MSAFKSKKRELNSELNLTTFIDLLSTMVCFLLISAVWVQVASMEVKQSKGTEAAATPKTAYEMDINYINEARAKIVLKKKGRRVKTYNVKASDNEELNLKLDSTLKEWLASKLGQAGKIEAAMITPVLGVKYGQLVAGLDVLRQNDIINIGVIPTGGN